MLSPLQRRTIDKCIKSSEINEGFFDTKDNGIDEVKIIYKPAQIHFRVVIKPATDVLPLRTHVCFTPDNRTLIINYKQELYHEVKTWAQVEIALDKWLSWIHEHYEHPATFAKSFNKLLESASKATAERERQQIADKQATEKAKTEQIKLLPTLTLAELHPIIYKAAGKLFTDGHYRQALLDAFIAVDNAVREKAQLTGSGTRLMEVTFSPSNPVLKIGDSSDEQQGFLSLFRGAMLAIRNPKAHSLGGTHDGQRAFEWLSFASVLLRNLDEATLIQPATPPLVL